MTIAQAFQTALLHHQHGRLAEAEALYRQILAADPRHADALQHMGIIAHQLGRNEVAADLISQAIALAPDAAPLHYNLGEVCLKLERFDEAITATRRALELQPQFPGAWCNLGLALAGRANFSEAIAAYRRALELLPDFPIAHNNLAIALRQLGRQGEAAEECRRAIQLRPDYAEAHNNLGIVLREQGHLDGAVAAGRKAAELMPGLPDAHNNLAAALKDQGRIAEAIATLRTALRLKPGSAEFHSNLLLTSHYSADADAPSLFAEHRRWDEVHARPLAGLIGKHGNVRDPERRLRIGYVSADFREHSVAFFLGSLLAAHDSEKAEVFCYADVVNEDAFTERFRLAAAHWRRITGMSDAEAAQMIRSDGIDILVDLAGHTSGSRLLVFARKPAPVQVTYLGYPDTTGMTAMDYRLTDAHADPPGMTEHLHSEKLVRLPDTAWCYRPAAESPSVCDLPATRAGRVTFGCFNAMAKITAEMLALWARLLAMVPDSRLLLKNAALGESSVRERTIAVFKKEGIEPERVDLLGRTRTAAEHLGAYGAVDIALDTHPYHGTTTTCEALWMGVPVVTLAGRTHVSRVGVSLLKSAGLPGLIAADVEDYLAISAGLAGDIPRLSALRAALRERMRGSVLTDGARFAQNVEDAYRKMWHGWCADERTHAGA